jgi:hypothetical protein
MDFYPSTHPTTWFRDRYLEGSLTIKPPYQRKPVWTARQKSYLIESLLLRLPIPELYIQEAHSPEGATSYAVVDGQQRIRTVFQFMGSEIDPEEEQYNGFALDKLPATSPFHNITFQELSDADKAAFYGYSFTVRFLRTPSDDEVRDMFRRLNKFLSPLNPQELRNATYTGPFVQLALRLAEDDYWVDSRIVLPADIRRMMDVEYVSQLLIGVLHGPQGGGSRTIDQYYEQYEDYEDEFPEQRDAERRFARTLQTIKAILPGIRETRWSNRADFYSLFVATAHLLRDRKQRAGQQTAVRGALIDFAARVATRLGDEEAKVPRDVAAYVAAVARGANEKSRRGIRHAVMLRLLDPYFA